MDDYIGGLDPGEVMASATSDPFGLGNSASSDKFAAFDAYVTKLVDDEHQGGSGQERNPLYHHSPNQHHHHNYHHLNHHGEGITNIVGDTESRLSDRLSVPGSNGTIGNLRMASLSPQPSSACLLNTRSGLDLDLSSQYPVSCPTSPFSFGNGPPSSPRGCLNPSAAVNSPVVGSARHPSGSGGGILGFDPGGNDNVGARDDGSGRQVTASSSLCDPANDGDLGHGSFDTSAENDEKIVPYSSLKLWDVTLSENKSMYKEEAEEYVYYRDRSNGDTVVDAADALEDLINSASSMNLDNSASFREGLILDPHLAQLLETQNSMVPEDFLQKCIQEMQQQNKEEQTEPFSLADPMETLLDVNREAKASKYYHSPIGCYGKDDITCNTKQDTIIGGINRDNFKNNFTAALPEFDISLQENANKSQFPCLDIENYRYQQQSHENSWHHNMILSSYTLEEEHQENRNLQKHQHQQILSSSSAFPQDSLSEHVQNSENTRQHGQKSSHAPNSSEISTDRNYPSLVYSPSSTDTSLSPSSPSKVYPNVPFPSTPSLSTRHAWQEATAGQCTLSLASNRVRNGRIGEVSRGPGSVTSGSMYIPDSKCDSLKVGISQMAPPSLEPMRRSSPNQRLSPSSTDFLLSRHMTSPLPPRIPLPHEVKSKSSPPSSLDLSEGLSTRPSTCSPYTSPSTPISGQHYQHQTSRASVTVSPATKVREI
ncbi:hypothetical protein PoB_001678200 [Plakobranchus ocellatus]|uniref:Uncharacterized protein n=1 Tax=Plakobranchus ocellatus TaxID=259542 RepID=A0AAV3Z6V1_9GAST|nr:hypothetical protein PoB_001678200 [Plakobranchus ocellatus]